MSELYLQRINLVLDYIRTHLTADLSLHQLSEVAGFSPFHFHRIFKVLTAETLQDYVLRLRLERAAMLLKTAPRLSITAAAQQAGFVSPSHFSRVFKQHYGITARAWDRQTPLKNSKNGQILDGFPLYTVAKLAEIADEREFEVYFRALPAQRVAYVRVTNSYAPERVARGYERLQAWYTAQGKAWSSALVLGMSQDDPEVTPLKLCRYDWCVAIPAEWQGNGEISVRTLPAMTLAAIHCCGDIYRVDRAWQYLFRYWLPRSPLLPANLPAMEIYRRLPLGELDWTEFDLDCAIPIVAL
jgi:AraC family transcriptional regulator